jgi:hypothetical protein
MVLATACTIEVFPTPDRPATNNAVTVQGQKLVRGMTRNRINAQTAKNNVLGSMDGESVQAEINAATKNIVNAHEGRPEWRPTDVVSIVEHEAEKMSGRHTFANRCFAQWVNFV